MALRTLAGQEFLTVNGIQTLSHAYVSLLAEARDIAALGVGHLRLSPHSQDMVTTARIFREVLDGRIEACEGHERLRRLGSPAPMANGFWHGCAGHTTVTKRG